MSTNCCVKSVPQPDSSYKVLPRAVTDWQQRLSAGLSRSIQASDQTMGHLEEEILQKTRELERVVLEEATQKKADQAPPLCPVCGTKLSRVTHGHERSYQTRFGEVTIRRSRGWCRRCKDWRFPADHRLGLAETGGCSPGVQEMAALGVSKLPVAEASAVIERLTVCVGRSLHHHAQNELPRHRPIDTAVGAVVPIIAQHEIMICLANPELGRISRAGEGLDVRAQVSLDQ
jgi:hypothetical protein